MENYMNEIEQIMQPYYDNQIYRKEFAAINLKEIEALNQRLSMLQETRETGKQKIVDQLSILQNLRKNEQQKLINQIDTLKNGIDNEINFLSIKLQNLRDEKENEINNYLLEESKKLGKNLEDQPYQLSKYFVNIKNDLENEYNKTEQKLVSRINELNEKKKQNNEYSNQIEELEAKIKSLDSETPEEMVLKSKIKSLDSETPEEIDLKNRIKIASNPNYLKSINIRETVDIKHEVDARLDRMMDKVQRQLIEKKSEKYQLTSVVKEHNNELEQEQKKYEEILQKLSPVNIESYDSKEWENLYKELNSVSNKIRNLQNPKLYILNTDEIDKEISDLEYIIQMINENIKIVEPTQEELYACLASINDSEREELDRRKVERNAKYNIENSSIEGLTEEPVRIDEIEIEEPIKADEIEIEEPIKVDEIKIEEPDEKISLPSDFVDTYTPVDYTYKFSSEDGKILVDSMSELCKLTFNDVIGVAKNIKSIKLDLSNKDDTIYFSSKFQNDGNYNLDLSSINSSALDGPISLPNGEYFNLSDINNALDNLLTRDKNITYMVKDINSEFTISNAKIKKIKKQLKKCSSIVLMSDKSLGETEIFGNSKSNENISKYVGRATTNLPDGEYISRNEFIAELKNVYKKSWPLWIKKCIQKVSDGVDYLSEENKNLLDDNIENHISHK